MEGTKKCPYCGGEIMATAKKCKHCKQWLTEKQSLTEPIRHQEIQSYSDKANNIEPQCDDSENNNRLWIGLLVAGAILILLFFYLGFSKSSSKDTPIETDVELANMSSDSQSQSYVEDDISNQTESSEEPVVIINEFYQYVLGEKPMTDEAIDKYLSPNLKKELWELDYDNSYSIFRFRTSAQDYELGTENISKVKDVTSEGDGWYTVTYLDMGHKGLTQVKVSDGKIVELKLDKSWNTNDTETVKKAYVQLLSQFVTNDEFSSNYYFLFDITGDGIPEIWIVSGTCEADYKLSVFTYDNGMVVIDAGEEGNAGHSSFYRGKDYIIRLSAHMGYANWKKITYRNGRLKRDDVFEEDLNQSGKEDYTVPSEAPVETHPVGDTRAIVAM